MRNLHRITLTVLASAAVIAGLTACDPDDNLSSPASLTTTTDSFARYTAPTSEMQIAAPKKVDPYSSNGRWRVPEQIAPGDYQATPTHPMGGYWEQVSAIGAEPGDPEFLSNDFITAPDYVHIGPDTKFIQLDDVTLTPAG